MQYTQTLVSTLSVFTILGQVIAVLVAIALMRKSNGVSSWVAKNGLLLMLITATIATAGSLFFSEVALWTPCRLCWFQRIFMYPQVALLAIALWKKDTNIAPYILALSIIGLLIAGFHYGEQISAMLFPAEIDPNAPCDISGTSCRSTAFFHFGYITIPMMAFTAFLLNIVGSVAVVKKS